jgi:hypothetical protein
VGEAVKVTVFSKTKQVSLKSRARRAGDGLTVDVFPLNALARTLPTLGKGSLVYIDLAGLVPREQARRLAAVSEHQDLLFGIMDSSGSVTDPAALFRIGAVDYIGRQLAKSGLSARRVRDILVYARSIHKNVDGAASGAVSTLRSWSEIIEGQEYPFYFLFFEADGAEEMKKRYGHENLARAMDTFRTFIERGVMPYGGKVWMWSGFGGIVLFPSSDGNIAPFVSAFRLMLWKPFYDVEESPLPNYLSFRLALSTGTMAYREKKTGGIVCDALNSVFHLGQRFTAPGQFAITADVFRATPDYLREFCVPVGAFEGRKVYRVRAPLLPSEQQEGEWPQEG